MATIVYYVPDVGFEEAEKTRRIQQMRPHLPRGYQIVFMSPPDGPEFVDIDDDVLQAVESVKKHFPTIGPEDCDAVLLGEALDAVLAAVKPLARVPLVAPGEETLRLAAKVGKPTSIVVMNQMDRVLAQSFVDALEVKPEIVSIRSMDIPLRELVGDLESAKATLTRTARQAVQEDAAEAIFLGAMTLNTLGLNNGLRKELGVPVYDPLRVGLRLAGELVFQQVGDVL
jgi:allantoin racemase